MDPKAKGLYTSEFALVLIKTIVGMLVMGGIVAPQHQDDVTSAFTTIVGGIIMLAPAVTYIAGRTWLKGKIVQGTPDTQVQVNPTTVVTANP